MPNRYPRDLSRTSHPQQSAPWPNQAKIAIQIVINYEEGGENNLLHGDAASEAFLSEITGAQPWPGQRHWNMESLYDYGARVGFWRLYEYFQNTPITIFGVASALARSPEQVSAMKAANWEIASHGFKWIEHKDMSADEEAEQITAALRLHYETVGALPRGWYTGRCSMNTVELVARSGDFAYIADSYADERPYWVKAGGKDQLIVPYTMDCNDMRFAIQAGFTEGAQFENYLKDSFDVLYEEGNSGAPKILSIGLHCRIAGRPGRFAALKRAIDYMKSHDNVWFATREEIADIWANAYPPIPFLRPSQMNEAEFVEAFGGIFEHSDWIAKRAYGLEFGAAHDNALGVHSLLSRIFRSASESERLSVLTAHPDLAGKLAQAKRLTASSTSEQASAGLDALTDDERALFTTLNTEYTEKFGFPFIIAVKDHNKASILENFQRRIMNSRQEEFQEACKQVERIAQLRLEALDFQNLGGG